MAEAIAGKSTLAGRRILVTGGSGFLGSHMVQRLLQEGATVATLARRADNLAGCATRHAHTLIACDVTDAPSTTAAVANFAPHTLFHFAAHPDARENFPQFQAAIQHNLVGTLNTLEAFRLSGGELLIYCDSTKVYGNSAVPYREAMPMQPTSSYGIAKAAGWQFCDLYRRLYGMATVSVRPTLTYGPRQGYNIINYVVDCVLSHKREVRLDGGTQTRDPVYIDDVVEAFLATARLGAQVGGRVINIGGGQEIRVSELAALIIELMGSRLPVVADSDRERPTEIWRNYCDNVEAQTILGWQPRTDLRTGLRQTIAALTAVRPAPPAV